MNIAINPNSLAALLPPPGFMPVITWSPDDVFHGWTEDGTNITVPIAAFTGLTADAADGTIGDVRKIIASFCATVFEWYNEAENKPGAIEISYRPGRVSSSGDFIGKQQAEFKVTVYLDYPDGTVAAEPGA